MVLVRLVVAMLIVLPVKVFSDAAVYDNFWQKNDNVVIEKIQAYWDTSDTRVILSNGEVCRITKEDKELFSVALAMKAQQLSGDVICRKDPVAGTNQRRLHRITY